MGIIGIIKFALIATVAIVLLTGGIPVAMFILAGIVLAVMAPK